MKQTNFVEASSSKVAGLVVPDGKPSGEALQKPEADPVPPVKSKTDTIVKSQTSPLPRPSPLPEKSFEKKSAEADLAVEDLLQVKPIKRKTAAPYTAEERRLPTKAEVKNAMAVIAPRIKKCGQGQGGRIRIKMAVSGATGRVVNAQVMDDDWMGTPIAICAMGEARLAKFSKFSEQMLIIKYPFNI